MSEPPRKAILTPVKPSTFPKPGTVPKLPQTIFNLEKRGGTGKSHAGRAPQGTPRGS